MQGVIIGWPQAIYLFLTVLALGFVVANHGRQRDPYNAPASIVATALVLSLLYWGGFFSA